MRTIALFAILALAPGLAAAQDDGLTATSSSAGLGAEIAAFDTTANGGNANLVGGNAHLQLGSFLRVEGRYLTGDLTSRFQGVKVRERANLVEGEATLGFAASDRTRIFAGGGYRFLESTPNPNGERLSHTLYVPLGVASHGRISSKWTAITTVVGGLVVRGEEEIENPTLGVDDTFTRKSGWMARASIEFGRSYVVGELSIEPFFRYFKLDESDPEGGVFVAETEATEAGVRFNYQL